MQKTSPNTDTPVAKQDSLEEILQTMLQAHKDLTEARELFDGLEPVSYTHLDVYKRQRGYATQGFRQARAAGAGKQGPRVWRRGGEDRCV